MIESREFVFDDGDPRQENSLLQTLRTSCMLCYYAREEQAEKVRELEDRIALAEQPHAGLAFIVNSIFAFVKEVLQNPLFEVCVIFGCLGYSVFARIMNPSLMLHKNILLNIVFTVGIICIALLLIGLLKSIVPALQYCKEVKACKSTYAEDQKKATIAQHMIEAVEDQLKELIKDGGVPEKYWDWGGEIWDYIQSKQADTLKEALELLESDIYQAKMQLAAQGKLNQNF